MAKADNLESRLAALTAEQRAVLERQLLAKAAKRGPRVSEAGPADGIPATRTPGRQSFPLSFTQQRIWFLEQLEPGSASYNVPSAFFLKGPLRLDYLEASLAKVIERHETLRTTFFANDGEPQQRVMDQQAPSLELVDLTHIPANQRTTEALRIATEAARKPFDLVNGPLLRTVVYRLGEEEHLLLLAMHHIVTDGWSLQILFRDISAAYSSFVTGTPHELPALPIQYADFSTWQRRSFEAGHLEKQVTYWRNRLQGAPSVLQIPTDRPRPAVQTFAGNVESDVLSPALSRALDELSSREGVTLYMLLLAAFQIMLWRYTGQTDILVGSPIAGRNRSQLEDLIGCFINTLTVRCDLTGDPTLRELLQRVRNTALEAYENQDVPFEKLVEELKPERELSHSPLFQVMLMLQSAPASSRELYGLEVTPLEINSGTAKFDLTVAVIQRPEGLRVGINYNSDLFDASTVRRMLGHFRTLLEEITANPGQRISQLNLLTAGETQVLLHTWNNTRRDYPRHVCVQELIERQAEQSPDAPAVIFEDQQLTYRELNRRANQLAHYLRGLGVAPDTLVGLCVERSLEMVVGLLGILKAGGAYVPLDPSYPPDRIAFMLGDAGVKVLLTEQKLMSSLPQGDAPLVCLDADWEKIARQETSNPPRIQTPEDLAYVIYTSGSTGKPKGVQIPQRAVVNFLCSMREQPGLTRSDTLLAVTTLSFDIAGLEIYLPLVCGAKVVLASREVASDGALLMRCLEESAATVMQATPATWRMLLAAGWNGDRRLKILCGGEALPGDLAEALCERCSELWNMYGPTETTIWSAAHRLHSREVVLGRPIANTQFYVLDSSRQLLPAGIPGELYIGGDGLARGYLHRPDLTAEKFVANPFTPELSERLYRTGDLVRWLPDGTIDYLGRIDHQVKIRGFRIELGEIETVLSAHPAVRQCVVVAHEYSASDHRLVAYVVATEAEQPNRSDLRRHLEAKLPDYMIPAAFVFLGQLPLTPNGKVDRKALPQPDQNATEAERAYVAPRTPTEEVVTGIWGEILRVSRVGVQDNFFDLGGHSLLATQVIARIRHVLEVELPLRTLFESPAPAGLAERIDTLRRSGVKSRVPTLTGTPRNAALPLSFAQQRLWFLNQLEPGSPFYSLPRALRMQGALNVEALERSLNEIVRRHEVLRTTFQTVANEPRQVIADSLQVAIAIVDLSLLPEHEKDAQAQKYIAEDLKRPFDLANGPLLRASLLKLAADDHILLLNTHHVVSDVWSMGLMSDELTDLYAAFSCGLPSPLPELKVQYPDYAAWQRSWLKAELLQEQLDYWKKQLAGAPPVLELPTDHPRPSVQSFHGASVSLQLPKALSDGLRALSRHEGTTLFMTLLAAYQLLLARHSGQEDVVVGSPVANRGWAETQDLIGFFANTLALRTDLSGNPTFRELLKRVKEVALGAYTHQDLPFERLVEEIQPERSLSHNPLFQAVFALQNEPVPLPALAGLRLNQFPIRRNNALFDVSLFMVERHDGLAARLEYQTDLFEEGSAHHMLERLEVLLHNIVANPDLRLSELPLLTDSEGRQLLVEWNATARNYDCRCAPDLFESQAARTPGGLAVSADGRQFTYAELNARANQLAHYLQQRGVGPESVVAICAERGWQMMVGILGVSKAGGAYLPLDPVYPPDRTAFILEESEARLVLTQEQLLPSMPQHVRTICLDRDWPLISSQDTGNPARATVPNHLAYVIYTSGSTGRPKGVEIQHDSLANLIAWHQRVYQVKESDRATQVAGPAFDAVVWEMWPYLTAGASLHIPNEEIRATPSKLAQWLAGQAITLSFVPTPVAEILVEQERPKGLKLRALLTGGDKLHRPSPRALPFAYNNHYGPTENTVVATWAPVLDEHASHAAPPIGRPVDNVQLYVLDRYQNPVPIGVVGELYIGGASLARGYRRRPDLTREKFVPNPFSDKPGARLYRTGDLVRYLPDGNLEFMGRADQQVKIRGFRIELGEIESVLASHPSVREAAVIVREDVPGDKRLVAYVAASAPAGEISGFLKKKLPPYMVPAAFVHLEALPLTPNGKVDRRALPAPSAVSLDEVDEAPRTAIQELVAGVWRDLLRLEKVGLHDDFFQLGGHSLLATQVLSRLRECLGVDLPLRAMFEIPTVAALAEKIESTQRERTGSALPALLPVSRDRDLPLSFAQQRLWFFSQLEKDGSFYNVPLAVRLTGTLDISALEWALNQIVARHEVLRTTFRVVNDSPIQVIAPELHISVPLTDLSALPEAGRETAAAQYAKQEAQTGFDLSQGPLLRPSLLRLAEQDHVLFLTAHHIVTDAWSSSVLLRELGMLYTAKVEGRPSPLAPLAVQYADYALWQREQLPKEIAEAGLRYWHNQLQGAPTLLALPPDRERPESQSFQGAKRTLLLGKELTEKLKHFSQREGATLFMVLLAGFQTLLSRYTGQEDLLIGTDLANRTCVETEKLIGFFINLLPLRADLRGNPTFREFLARVRETALGAYAHQDVPFEKLVEELRVERSPAHNPLVQVLFVMQNTPRSGLQLPNLKISSFSMPMERSKFDVAVFMADGEQGLTAHWVFSTDLFEEATIERMAAHYQQLLSNALAQPDARVNMLEFLTEEEREQRSLEKQERRQSKLKKLKGVDAKPVSIPAGASTADGSDRRM